ncbi:MAG: hypothetical protein MUD12_12080 [Spirochaetes bacterium]|jgi:hypothetical protein|nr:hypothetical protein [Spirochaetota bacterium]
MNKKYFYILIMSGFLFIYGNSAVSGASFKFLTPGIYKSVNESGRRLFLSIRENEKKPAVSLIVDEQAEYVCTVRPAGDAPVFGIDLNLKKTIGDPPVDFKTSKGTIYIHDCEIKLVLGEKKFDLKKVNLWDITYEGMSAPGERFEMIFGSVDKPDREYFHVMPGRNDSAVFYHFSKKKPGLIQYSAADWRLLLGDKTSNDEQNQAAQDALRICFTLESDAAPAIEWEIDFRRSPVTDLGALVGGIGKKKTRFWQSNDSNTMLFCFCSGKRDKKNCERIYRVSFPGKEKDDMEFLNFQPGKNSVGIFDGDAGSGSFMSSDKKTVYQIIRPGGNDDPVIKQLSPAKKTFRQVEMRGGKTCR